MASSCFTSADSLGNRLILTTDEVLTEFLNALSGDSFLRSAGASLVTAIAADPAIIVEPQSHESFMAGLALYERRPDKGYSLTDCVSMQACHAAGITEVLTSDHHFAQEGFTLLITR